jgi:hypothetical protein
MAQQLNKQHYLDFQRCPKLAWYRVNAPKLLKTPDEVAQASMKQGREITLLAQSLFQRGNRLSAQQLKPVQQSRVTLFEKSFVHEDLVARCDIIDPVGPGDWNLIEIKSGTEVTADYVADVAFQTNVIKRHLKLNRIKIGYINKNCEYDKTLIPKNLFSYTDVTSNVLRLQAEIEAAVKKLRAVRDAQSAPTIDVGTHCTKNGECPLYDTCWKLVPTSNVFDLYRGGVAATKLFKSGIVNLSAIPAELKLTLPQAVQRSVALTGRPHINTEAIGGFLKRLKYPAAFLDFETLNPAVPVYPNSKPYAQIPFQFSCHVVDKEGQKPTWFGFLASSKADPRPEFMKTLRDGLPADGSIVVFNGAFEKARLKECAVLLPDYAAWNNALQPRLFDLLEPFQKFDYYHPDQKGSASLKAVLPVLTKRSYSDLLIQNGARATAEFIRMIFGNVSTTDQTQIRQALEAYCERDTISMIWILDALRRLVVTSR